MSLFGKLQVKSMLWSARRLPKDKREQILLIIAGQLSKEMVKIGDNCKLLLELLSKSERDNEVVRLSLRLKEFCRDNAKYVEGKSVEAMGEGERVFECIALNMDSIDRILFVKKKMPGLLKEVEQGAIRAISKQLNL